MPVELLLVGIGAGEREIDIVDDPASCAPGLPGAPGMIRSASAPTVCSSETLKKAPVPSPRPVRVACAMGIAIVGGAAWAGVCAAASATGIRPVVAAAPIPVAVWIRNARRALSGVLMDISFAGPLRLEAMRARWAGWLRFAVYY